MTIGTAQWVRQVAVTISLGAVASSAFADDASPSRGSYKTSEACVASVLSTDGFDVPRPMYPLQTMDGGIAYRAYRNYADPANDEEGSIRATVALNQAAHVEWVEIEMSRHAPGSSLGMDAVNNAMIIFTDEGARTGSSETLDPGARLRAETIVAQLNNRLRDCRLEMQ